MNQIVFQPCTYKEFPMVRPMLDGHSDVFDFIQKRLIVSQTSKALDEGFGGQTAFVAMHDDVVIGFCGGLRDNNNPFQLNLICLVVKRGYNNQGVGTALFHHTCQELSKLGFTQIVARVDGTYPPRAKDYYRRLGFKPWFSEDYTGASDQDMSMMLKLPPNKV